MNEILGKTISATGQWLSVLPYVRLVAGRPLSRTYESFGDFEDQGRKVQVPDVKVVIQEMWWEVRRYLSERQPMTGCAKPNSNIKPRNARSTS